MTTGTNPRRPDRPPRPLLVCAALAGAACGLVRPSQWSEAARRRIEHELARNGTVATVRAVELGALEGVVLRGVRVRPPADPARALDVERAAFRASPMTYVELARATPKRRAALAARWLYPAAFSRWPVQIEVDRARCGPFHLERLRFTSGRVVSLNASGGYDLEGGLTGFLGADPRLDVAVDLGPIDLSLALTLTLHTDELAANLARLWQSQPGARAPGAGPPWDLVQAARVRADGRCVRLDAKVAAGPYLAQLRSMLDSIDREASKTSLP